MQGWALQYHITWRTGTRTLSGRRCRRSLPEAQSSGLILSRRNSQSMRAEERHSEPAFDGAQRSATPNFLADGPSSTSIADGVSLSLAGDLGADHHSAASVSMTIASQAELLQTIEGICTMAASNCCSSRVRFSRAPPRFAANARRSQPHAANGVLFRSDMGWVSS